MKNVDLLLNDLNNMHPLSAGFWTDFQNLVSEDKKKVNYVFLEPGNIAKKTWQVISGFIVAMRTNSKGEEYVFRIYYPKDIVADLVGLFENVPIRSKFIAATDVVVLEITKTNLTSLQHYPETDKLIRRINLIQTIEFESILEMLRLPEEDRVPFFLEQYPTEGLPDSICASLLNLTPERYSTLKQAILPYIHPKPLPPTDIRALENTNDLAYKIKNYLIANYKNHALVKNERIVEKYQTNIASLKRIFEHSFGMTIHEFIIKRRMEFAAKLIKKDKMQIKEAAMNVGYKNFSQFSKTFSHYYGCSPRAYQVRK